jgi:hypothetical protein
VYSRGKVFYDPLAGELEVGGEVMLQGVHVQGWPRPEVNGNGPNGGREGGWDILLA